MMKTARLAAALAAAVTLAACNGPDSPSSLVTTTFTGTLAPAEQQSQSFSVSKTGELELTLMSLTPRPVLGFVSLGVGQTVSGTCALIAGYYVPQAAIGQPSAFPQISKGTYCVRIADDNFALTQPAAFSVRVVHP